ncbi:MAG: adenylate/guanylate cyclase domain-containing protein, partial [Spirochaetales bacterium]|nr:adenylate/guanylate cyclase domain-containing protein [Spirochaetales bacterium]
LLPPEPLSPGTLVNIPETWNGSVIHASCGYATYSLEIDLPGGTGVWGLEIPVLAPSYRLYAGHKLIAQAGEPGTSPATSTPGFGPRTVYFSLPAHSSRIFLTLQLANFIYPKTGLRDSLLLGTSATVSKAHAEEEFVEFFMLGALLILLFYYAGMSLLERSDASFTWLAVFGLAVVLRLLATDQNTLNVLFPQLPWELRVRFELLIFNLGALPLLFFFQKSFPRDFSSWLPKLMAGLFGVFSVLLIAFPLQLSTQLITVMELLIGLSFIYVLQRLFSAVFKGRPGALLTSITTSILALASINDILFSQQLISSTYLMPAAFLIFLLLQALFLARKLFRTFKTAESQRDQLDSTNRSLARFVPDGFLTSLGKTNITEVQLGQQALSKMVVMFADIRRFTALADQLPPEKTFRLLNSYYSRVGPVIRQHGGFIDKYMGDGFMALFPYKPDEGLQAAVDLQRAVQVYNFHRANFNYPSLSVGCGVHAGPLVIGTIGEESRMDTTVISDVVNLSSRLEGLTKIFGTGTMVALPFLDTLEQPENFHWRYAGVVRMYGKKVGLEVAHVWDGLPDEDCELYAQQKATFEEGVYLYRTGQLAQAEEAFLEVLSRHPGDLGARHYANRSKLLREFGLPENWDAIEDQIQK